MAEKRKAILDELSIKYQKEYDSHRENVTKAEEKHNEELDKLQQELETQKVRMYFGLGMSVRQNGEIPFLPPTCYAAFPLYPLSGVQG